MIDVIIRGIGGQMGKTVLELVQGEKDMRCVAGVDIRPVQAGVPVYASFAEVKERADVAIDFSAAEGLEDELAWAERNGCGLVLASTGYSEADLARIERCAKQVAVFKTANLSIGVNLLQALVQRAAEVLGEGSFDTSVGWKISGASDPATKIDGNGMLTVGAGETAESFTVTAVSVFDPEKSASAVVTVLSGEPSEPGQDPSEPGQDPSEPGGGLPAGAIAAIVLGAVVLVAAAAVAVWFIVKRSGKKN